jgi:hypothetical protein
MSHKNFGTIRVAGPADEVATFHKWLLDEEAKTPCDKFSYEVIATDGKGRPLAINYSCERHYEQPNILMRWPVPQPHGLNVAIEIVINFAFGDLIGKVYNGTHQVYNNSNQVIDGAEVLARARHQFLSIALNHGVRLTA